jgi:hypothetical protein
MVPELEEPPVSLANILLEAENGLRKRFEAQEPNCSANVIEDCLAVLRHIYRGNKLGSITQRKDAMLKLCHILQVKDGQDEPYLSTTKDTKVTKQQMYDALQIHQPVRLDMSHFDHDVH